ncbi:glycine cleavage system protein H, partial [Escherichia coli]|nr:glycine cleavage system protein H [Escherichia coli]
MSLPKDLLYTEEHEWVKADEGSYVIGITDFAQDQLGDIVFVELPEVGDTVAKGDSI